MHQDLRVLPVREERAPDARAPGEQAQAEGDDRCYPNDTAELWLLPPRPGRLRAHGARASPCRATGASAGGSPPSAGVRMGEWGRRSRRCTRAPKRDTRVRGRNSEAPRPVSYGSGADDSRPRPLHASFVIFKLFGLWHFSQCLGSKSVLLHRILGEIRDLGCPTSALGLQRKKPSGLGSSLTSTQEAAE